MYKNFKLKTLLFTLISSLVLTACSTKSIDKEENTERIVFENSKFQALELNKNLVKKSEKKAFISFDKDFKIYGNLGCNNFFGSYKIEKNKLFLGQVGSTMMMCQDMSTERDFLDVLQNTKTYKLQNDILELFNENGENIAKFRKD